MRSLAAVLIAIVVTFLAWGSYGPVLHEGQYLMGEGGQPSSLRPFICVGIAYFLIAVVVPLVMLWSSGEKGKWSLRGAIWSFGAGAAGAIGALGIIWAFKLRGSPVYVMPLVFGLAPVVNTGVTMWITHTYDRASRLFFVGVLMVAVGAAGVLFFKPKPVKPDEVQKQDGKTVISAKLESGNHAEVTMDDKQKVTVEITFSSVNTKSVGPLSAAELKEEDETAHKAYLEVKNRFGKYLRGGPSFLQSIGVILCVVLTALCWGSYGPTLHKGQARMEGSRLRPFLCVGLAYFAIAVIVPSLILSGYVEPGSWNGWGVAWSLLAGTAGAVGALGIIMAFNFGGRPIFVMPLVFGGAPVVNTAISLAQQQTFEKIGTAFYVSLFMVIGGATCVLVFAPKPGKKKEEEEVPKEKFKKDAPQRDDTSREPEKETTKQETTERETTKQEATKREAAEREAAEPDSSGQETGESETLERQTGEPGDLEQETGEPNDFEQDMKAKDEPQE